MPDIIPQSSCDYKLRDVVEIERELRRIHPSPSLMREPSIYILPLTDGDYFNATALWSVRTGLEGRGRWRQVRSPQELVKADVAALTASEATWLP